MLCIFLVSVVGLRRSNGQPRLISFTGAAICPSCVQHVMCGVFWCRNEWWVPGKIVEAREQLQWVWKVFSFSCPPLAVCKAAVLTAKGFGNLCDSKRLPKVFDRHETVKVSM